MITVRILQKETDEPREEIFGVKIFDASPQGVKVSKKDTCFVEIVSDQEGKKKAEALEQLLEMVKS
jgi:hypothetical protein